MEEISGGDLYGRIIPWGNLLYRKDFYGRRGGTPCIA